MPSFFDDQSIDIACPKCGKEHSETISWLKSHRQIACTCGARLDLELDDLLGPLEHLEDDIDSIPREIRIKL
jgi:hypothetical protein